jgi:hypothetical protein
MKTYTEFVNEAMSRRDALKMAAAKAAFFKKGGKVEKQPPSVAMGYTKKRGVRLGKSNPLSQLDLYRGIDDQDAAKEIEKFRKDKGYMPIKDKKGSRPNPSYGKGRTDKKPRYKGGYQYKGSMPKQRYEENENL